MKSLLVFLVGALLVAFPRIAAAGDDRGSDNQPRLGIMVVPLTPELREHFGAAPDRGVLVARVQPASPAAAAGIAVGDVVTDVGGQPVDDASDVTAALSTKRGDQITVGIVRHGKSSTLRATIPAVDVSAILKLFDWFVPLTSEVPSTASAKATLDGS